MVARDGAGRDRGFTDTLANSDVRRALVAQGTGTTTQYLVTTALAIQIVEVLGPGSLWLISLRYCRRRCSGP